MNSPQPSPPRSGATAARTSWTKRLARFTRGSSASRLYLTLAAPGFWLFTFLVVPLVFVAIYGFARYDDAYVLQIAPPDSANYLDAISIGPRAKVIPLLLRTFGMATLTTIVSLAVGYSMAYFIARIAKERWRGILMGLVVIPFWVSFIVRIYAVFPFTQDYPTSFYHTALRSVGLGALSDWSGAFFNLGTPQMVVFTLMYVWLPFMILPLFASLSKLDPILLEAASDLGASRWRAFLHVTLPLTYPAMIVGSILIFITTVGAFIELELVGGGSWLFIGNYINNQFQIIGGLPSASASSLFIIIVTVLLISVYRKYAELEEEGETEVKSRVFRPLFNYVKRILRARKPAEPSPTGATMPDGGLPTAPVPHRYAGPIRKASWERVLDRVTEKAGKYLLGAFTFLMLLFFFVPLIVVAIFSFNGIDSPVVFEGFSFQWWVGGGLGRDALFDDEASLLAIWYSFLVAFLSSGIAVVIGLFAAFSITRYHFRARGVFRTLMYLGLVVPSIVMGISLAVLIRFLNYYVLGPLSLAYGFGSPVQWDFGLASIVVGHTTFNIPLATLVLFISFREFDRTLEEAAMNLGADEITTFLRVTLPNILPGIISALLLGFTFSFDELPVTLFLQGGGVQTLPIIIYGLISKKILTPRVNAAATIVLIISFVFVIVMTRLGKRGGQLFRI